jgi:hypothetical protein
MVFVECRGIRAPSFPIIGNLLSHVNRYLVRGSENMNCDSDATAARKLQIEERRAFTQ